MVNIRRGSLYVLNDNIERPVQAAFQAGINAGGNLCVIEFFSTKEATTMNARMKVRQFTMGTII
jgi:hypothetical protein